jgi:hypothetical protein
MSTICPVCLRKRTSPWRSRARYCQPFVRSFTHEAESWLGDAELAFFGNMFSPSVILASNAVAGFSGRLGEDSEHYIPPTQFNGSLAEDECLTNLEFAHCATLMLSTRWSPTEIENAYGSPEQLLFFQPAVPSPVIGAS